MNKKYKKIAETEVIDNQEWYITNINNYESAEEFIDDEAAEIAYEYNLSEDVATKVCKEIYKFANNLKKKYKNEEELYDEMEI